MLSSENKSKFEIHRYTRVIYLKSKLRTFTIQTRKEKLRFFAERIDFDTSNFFSKVDPMMSKHTPTNCIELPSYQPHNFQIEVLVATEVKLSFPPSLQHISNT